MADKVTGVLEVGTNEQGEVIINHPDLPRDQNGVGHIVFSPKQARNLARLMFKKSREAEGRPEIKNRDGKIACVEVTRPETHGGLYCIWPLSGFSAADELDGAEDGESIVVTLKMMTQEEFDGLSPFEGW